MVGGGAGGGEAREGMEREGKSRRDGGEEASFVLLCFSVTRKLPTKSWLSVSLDEDVAAAVAVSFSVALLAFLLPWSSPLLGMALLWHCSFSGSSVVAFFTWFLWHCSSC